MIQMLLMSTWLQEKVVTHLKRSGKGMLLTSTRGCMLAGMRPRKPYHHGHLEETLLKTAIQLIGEVGPAGFTLREVARRAGVSHNAPYRHFADREKLLAGGASQGFRELTRAMRDAAQEEAKALDQLKAAGLAYIEFALRRPELGRAS